MPIHLLRTAPQGSAMRRIYDDKNYIVMDGAKLIDAVKNDPKTLVWHMSDAAFVDDTIVTLDIREAKTIDKALAFKKNSELTILFNHVMLKIKESGLISRIRNKWKGDRDEVFGIAEPVVLTYDNLFFPFAWLALGILVAIPITMVEIVVGRYRASKELAI